MHWVSRGEFYFQGLMENLRQEKISRFETSKEGLLISSIIQLIIVLEVVKITLGPSKVVGIFFPAQLSSWHCRELFSNFKVEALLHWRPSWWLLLFVCNLVYFCSDYTVLPSNVHFVHNNNLCQALWPLTRGALSLSMVATLGPTSQSSAWLLPDLAASAQRSSEQRIKLLSKMGMFALTLTQILCQVELIRNDWHGLDA